MELEGSYMPFSSIGSPNIFLPAGYRGQVTIDATSILTYLLKEGRTTGKLVIIPTTLEEEASSPTQIVGGIDLVIEYSHK